MILVPQKSITLYHGSYCIVSEPDLRRCNEGKDFGRGFYTTTSKVQAENFAKISTRRAIYNQLVPDDTDRGFVSVYNLVLDETLSYYEFSGTDAEWLHCIAANRKPKIYSHKQQILDLHAVEDILAGKVANDDTNATLTLYLAGVFGEPGSESADGTCIKLLRPERLENQICFRSERSLKQLSYLGEESVWLTQH